MSACFCRGGPTCCRVIAARAEQHLYWNSLADWSQQQYQLATLPERSEWEWQQRFAEYQGA